MSCQNVCLLRFRIISTVLGWDINKLKKRASQIESNKQGPTKEQLKTLREYVGLSQVEQEQRRSQSSLSTYFPAFLFRSWALLIDPGSKNESIVATILSSTSLPSTAHSLALEYLSLKLSVRDREQLIEVLCRRNPDLVTPTARDLISAYDPIIRAVHNAVDLAGTVADAQAFIDDLIKLSKTQSNKSSQITVEDYVKLLEKHQNSSHQFLHQVCKNGKELAAWYKDFVHMVASKFRVLDEGVPKLSDSAEAKLKALVADLSTSDRDNVLEEVHRHAEYLKQLSDSSSARIKATLEKKSTTTYGPGVYLARWQALLDNTVITPSQPKGQVRKAGSKEAKEASRTDVDGEKEGNANAEKQVEEEAVKAPYVGTIVKLLMSKFWEMLREWGDKT